jgi:hypothetical protein
MNYEEATDRVKNIQKAVISTKSDTVLQVFSALVFLDGYWIKQRAKLFLAQTTHAHLKAMRQAGDDPHHRLTMEVFYASLQEYLHVEDCNRKSPGLQSSPFSDHIICNCDGG